MADPTTPPAPAAGAPAAPAAPAETLLSDVLPPDRLPVVRPDGTFASVKREKYEDALKAGYRFQSPEEQQSFHDELKYGNRPIAAGVAGAGRGVSFGLTDAALTATGLVEPQTLRGLQKENPGATTTGEVVGSIAPLLIPGVGEFTAPGVALKAGRLLESGVGLANATTRLGRIGGGVVRGIGEGALFGVGRSITDAALGDPDLTAEKVIANIGMGALLGAGGGGVGSVIDEGVSAVLPKIAKSVLGAKGSLEEFANDRWLKAAGAIKSDISKIPEAEEQAVADAMRRHLAQPGSPLPKSLDDALTSLKAERKVVGDQILKEAGITQTGGLHADMTQEEALQALKGAKDEVGQKMNLIYQQADQLGARPVFSELRQRISAFRNGLGEVERETVEPHIQRLEQLLDRMGAKPVGPATNFQALNKERAALDEEIKKLYVSGDTLQARLRKQLVHELRDELEIQMAPQVGSKLTKDFLDAKAEYGALATAEDAIKKAGSGSTALEAIIEKAADAGKPLASAPQFSALQHANRVLTNGIDRKLGNRWYSATDYLTGMGYGVAHAAAGNPLPLIKGIAAGAAHKFLRENGSAVIAKLADRIAASPSLSMTAQSFAQALNNITPKMGSYGPLLANALGHSPAMALATHMALAQTDSEYEKRAEAAGLVPEQTPEEGAAALAKAHRLAQIHQVAQDTDKQIDKYLDKVLSGKLKTPEPSKAHSSQDFGLKRMNKDSQAAHEQRVKEVTALAANPEALIARVAKNLEGFGVAPTVAAQLSSKAQRAIQYLATEGAAPPPGGPLAAKWVVPHADIHEYAKKVEVVEDPLSILKHAASGTLTDDQMDTLRAVHPALAKDIAEKAMEKMADPPKNVPYGARLMLSLLSGIDPDGSFSSEAIRENQTAILRSEVRGAAKKQTAGGSSNVTLAERTAMPNQGHEAEEA